MLSSHWILRNIGCTISLKTVYTYFDSLRTIISDYIKDYLPLIELEGAIEIDETFIGAKRRTDHGRIPKSHHTVFGNFLINNTV